MNDHVAEPLRTAVNAFAPTVDGEAVNYSTLPIHGDSIRRYIERRVDPGTGLRMILAHDLMAVCYCDGDTVSCLPEVMRWLHNHAPSRCHGSAERVQAWLAGREEAHAA